MVKIKRVTVRCFLHVMLMLGVLAFMRDSVHNRVSLIYTNDAPCVFKMLPHPINGLPGLITLHCIEVLHYVSVHMLYYKRCRLKILDISAKRLCSIEILQLHRNVVLKPCPDIAVELVSCLSKNVQLDITDSQSGGVMFINKNGIAYNVQPTENGTVFYSCTFDECQLAWVTYKV